MRIRSLKRISIIAVTTVAFAGGAVASIDLFAYPNLPLPEEALELIQLDLQSLSSQAKF